MARWQRPGIWIILFGATAAALFFASRHFSDAFPIVSVDVEAQRGEVVEEARSRAGAEAWGMEGYRSAVSFGLREREAKTYVELEGGGREVWQRLVSGRDFEPYIWTVRLFRPSETKEARVRFAPDGTAVGFSLRLPEDAPGGSLSPDSARALAEAWAMERWSVDLAPYRFISRAEEERPGGRTDHEFVYEQSEGETVGEARFRLRLEVDGDQVTGIERFVEVPETFSRAYREMRSSNDLIAFGATLAAGLLYGLVGCGVGLLWLLRRNGLRVRPAVVVAGVVAGLLAAERLNRIPLSWMGYDTAVPRGDFLASEIGSAALAFGGALLLLTLVFTVGEGLVRHAFPGQPRLWKSGSRGAAESDPILGQTLGGYLYAGLAIPYVIGFYLLTTRYLGWWTPAEALVEPDLLATPFPWLSAVATALFAATNEELLFRAVPLAGAALLGEKLGRRKLWIGGALVAQAVIFAAAHANYPQQPAYARFVELLLPAMAFGFLVVRFGLLPAILGHFLFNLAWMSLPLFTASGTGLRIDPMVVLAAGLGPLLLVVGMRLRRGAREELPEALQNRGDVGTDRPGRGKGPENEDESAVDLPAPEDPSFLPLLSLRVLFPLGLAGIVAWSLAADPGRDAPALEWTREAAVERAREILRAQEAPEGEPWRLLARVRAERSREHRYVWEEHGAGPYRGLVGTYLGGPRWVVRQVRFEGDVEERTREWRVEIGARGRIQRLRHELPELAPGDTLAEVEARGLARRALLRRFAISAPRTEDISAEAVQRPGRRDWIFTFRDRVVEIDPGEARMEVQLAGSRPIDARLFVHVPEEWERRDRARSTREGIRRLVAGSLLALIVVMVAGYGVVRWGRGRFPVRALAAVGGSSLLLLLLDLVNRLPEATASFSTAQPYGHQLAMALGSGAFAALLGAALSGLLAGVGHTPARRGTHRRLHLSLAAGLCVGMVAAGAMAVVGLLDPLRLPPWPDYGVADALVPWLEDPFEAALALLAVGAGLLALFASLERLGVRWGARLAVGSGASLVLGFGLAGVGPLPMGGAWLAAGLGFSFLTGLLYLAWSRWGPGVIPAVVATFLFLEYGSRAWIVPEPGSRAGSLLALGVLAAGAWIWSRALTSPSKRRTPPGS